VSGRLARWVREADVVVWLMLAFVILLILLIVLVAVQTANAQCHTIIDDLQLPTLSGGDRD
jgi:hypothetical protein